MKREPVNGQEARRAVAEELDWQRLLWVSATGIALELGREVGGLDPESARALQEALQRAIAGGDVQAATKAARALGEAHVAAVAKGTKARRKEKRA